MASVLLVGFASDIEASLSRALRAQGHTIQAAQTASTALRIVREATPVLILIHAELQPDAGVSTPHDGFELCGAIRALPDGHKSMIIFINHQDTLANKLSSFIVGADDYLAIPFQMAELILRIDALLRRSALGVAPSAVTSSWLRFGPLALDQTTGDVWIADRHEQLTPMETRLLRYLIANPGRPCSAEDLLRHVWRQDPGTGDPVLVRVHMRHLRAKLETDPAAPKLLKTNRRLGYYLAQDEINEST